MKKHLGIICCCFTLSTLLFSFSAAAETIIKVKEYTYQASEADSKQSARWSALEQVKRLLLEEVGSYLESSTEVRNFMLSKDEIITLTGGILKTEVIKEFWNGEIYWVSAKVCAESESVIKSIDRLRQNNELKRELERQKAVSEEATKEKENLRKQLEKAKADSFKVAEYEQALNQIADRQKQGLYYLAAAKVAAKKPGQEKQTQELRQKAVQLLGEAMVNTELPEFKIYTPGKYEIMLNAGDQLDHWIAFSDTDQIRYTTDDEDGATVRVYANGKIAEYNEFVVTQERFKFQAIKSCRFNFVVY